MTPANNPYFQPFSTGTASPFTVLGIDQVVRLIDVRPEIIKEISDYNDIRHGISDFLDLTGSAVKVETDLQYHTQQGSMFRNFKAASFTGGGSAGAAIVVTLAADDVVLSGGVYYSPIEQIGQVFELTKNPDVQLVVTAFDGPGVSATKTVTLAPLNTALTLNTLVTALDVFGAKGAMAAPQQTFQTGGTMGWERYLVKWGYMQTPTPVITADDYNQAFRLNFDGGGEFLVMKYEMETYGKHEINRNKAVMFHQGKDYTISGGTNDGLAQKQIMGFIPQAKAFGLNANFNTTWGMADLVALEDYIRANQIGSTVYVHYGYKFMQRAQNIAKTNFTNGDVIYNSGNTLGIAGDEDVLKQRFLSLGVKGFMLGGLTMLFREAVEFNSQDSMGVRNRAVDQDAVWPNSALITPVNTRMANGSAVAVSGVETRLLYKEMPSTPGAPATRIRRIEQGSAINNKESHKVILAEDYALQIANAQKLISITVS
jgi:hypothetical protein